jgi:fatty acid desaturase
VPSNDGWAQDSERRDKKEVEMLEALVIILVVLWALGFFAFHVGGGLIHALIVIALIILIVRLLKGRKVL